MEKLVREFIAEGILNETPEPKDIKRIEDLFHRSKGSDPKLLQLTQNMANSIDDIDKAQRRAEAAQQILGPEDNPIADIFFKRVEQLKSGGKELGSGKPLKPDKSEIKFEKPVEKLPTENPNPTKEDVKHIYSNGNIHYYEGVIYLPSYSSIVLWDWEITGQLSDGAWENTQPERHWKFWAELAPKLGIPEVKSSGRPLKTGYNLAGLIEYVGDRMINYGRFGKAVGKDIFSMLGSEVRCTIEEFPAAGPFDLAQWKQEMIQGKDWRAKDYYWKGLEQKHVDAYYNTKYDEREMRKDLAYIKQAMKNISSIAPIK